MMTILFRLNVNKKKHDVFFNIRTKQMTNCKLNEEQSMLVLLIKLKNLVDH